MLLSKGELERIRMLSTKQPQGTIEEIVRRIVERFQPERGKRVHEQEEAIRRK